jgi:hypothetical protein
MPANYGFVVQSVERQFEELHVKSSILFKTTNYGLKKVNTLRVQNKKYD